MNIINKLFKREIKNLQEESKNIEKAFNKLEEKILLIKNSDKRILIKDEIKRLIRNSNEIIEQRASMRVYYPDNYSSKLAQLNKEIDDLLDELIK